MKQTIDFSTITACGECCTDCQKRVSGVCKGCIKYTCRTISGTGGWSRMIDFIKASAEDIELLMLSRLEMRRVVNGT